MLTYEEQLKLKEKLEELLDEEILQLPQFPYDEVIKKLVMIIELQQGKPKPKKKKQKSEVK